jgi:hypothetical protein
VSWSNIKVPHLLRLLADVCLETLVKCSRLTEYRVIGARAALVENGQAHLPHTPFVLQYLIVLEWPVRLTNSGRAMLQYIRVPALRSAIWKERHSQPVEPSNAVSNSFECLPSTMSGLRIRSLHTNFSDASIVSLF